MDSIHEYIRRMQQSNHYALPVASLSLLAIGWISVYFLLRSRKRDFGMRTHDPLRGYLAQFSWAIAGVIQLCSLLALLGPNATLPSSLPQDLRLGIGSIVVTCLNLLCIMGAVALTPRLYPRKDPRPVVDRSPVVDGDGSVEVGFMRGALATDDHTDDGLYEPPISDRTRSGGGRHSRNRASTLGVDDGSGLAPPLDPLNRRAVQGQDDLAPPTQPQPLVASQGGGNGLAPLLDPLNRPAVQGQGDLPVPPIQPQPIIVSQTDDGRGNVPPTDVRHSRNRAPPSVGQSNDGSQESITGQISSDDNPIQMTREEEEEDERSIPPPKQPGNAQYRKVKGITPRTEPNRGFVPPEIIDEEDNQADPYPADMMLHVPPDTAVFQEDQTDEQEDQTDEPPIIPRVHQHQSLDQIYNTGNQEVRFDVEPRRQTSVLNRQTSRTLNRRKSSILGPNNPRYRPAIPPPPPDQTGGIVLADGTSISPPSRPETIYAQTDFNASNVNISQDQYSPDFYAQPGQSVHTGELIPPLHLQQPLDGMYRSENPSEVTITGYPKSDDRDQAVRRRLTIMGPPQGLDGEYPYPPQTGGQRHDFFNNNGDDDDDLHSGFGEHPTNVPWPIPGFATAHPTTHRALRGIPQTLFELDELYSSEEEIAPQSSTAGAKGKNRDDRSYPGPTEFGWMNLTEQRSYHEPSPPADDRPIHSSSGGSEAPAPVKGLYYAEFDTASENDDEHDPGEYDFSDGEYSPQKRSGAFDLPPLENGHFESTGDQHSDLSGAAPQPIVRNVRGGRQPVSIKKGDLQQRRSVRGKNPSGGEHTGHA